MNATLWSSYASFGSTPIIALGIGVIFLVILLVWSLKPNEPLMEERERSKT